MLKMRLSNNDNRTINPLNTAYIWGSIAPTRIVSQFTALARLEHQKGRLLRKKVSTVLAILRINDLQIFFLVA